jgi:hypothetical protein
MTCAVPEIILVVMAPRALALPIASRCREISCSGVSFWASAGRANEIINTTGNPMAAVILTMLDWGIS